MDEFARVAFVWGDTECDAPLAQPPSISAALWAHALGCDLLRWKPGEMPDISKYDLFLVNVFHTKGSTHVQQIKKKRPEAVVVAMADPPIDMVLERPDWLPMWAELGAADIIGGRTWHDCAVYGTFFAKPAVWMPSPAGPLDYFLPFRDLPKEDYIITLDRWGSHTTGQNVAALAAIQRETGLRVVYARPHPHTKVLAGLAGLEAEWREPNIPWLEMIEVTARARLCVDLYARHSYGRQGVLCALVGTPCVGSAWTNDAGQRTLSPFDPDLALDVALELLNDADLYAEYRQRGFVLVNRRYSFAEARLRVRDLLRLEVTA